MKLRLVREDGTPARIEDLLTFPDVDIDGVPVSLVEYEGPDGADETDVVGSESGTIELKLTFDSHRRDAYVHDGPGKTRIVPKFTCPFARKARQRAKEAQ